MIYKEVDIMFFSEDNTYNDIRKKSLEQWLTDMEQHDDLAVKGGVALVRGYIEHLESDNKRLRDENKLKNNYLKKVAGKI